MHELCDYTSSVLPVRDAYGWLRNCLEISQLGGFVEVSYILYRFFGKPIGFPGFHHHAGHCKGSVLLSFALKFSRTGSMKTSALIARCHLCNLLLSLDFRVTQRCVVVTNSVRSPVVHVRRRHTLCDSALMQALGLLCHILLLYVNLH